MKEIWKDIKGYDYPYKISNLGRIKSMEFTVTNKDGVIKIRKEKIRKLYKGNNGYYSVSLRLEGKQKLRTVHRLVAGAFLEKIKNKEYVNHKDGNKLNNYYENLEYCTIAENNTHSFDNGMSKKGEKCSYSLLNESQVREIYKLTTVDGIRCRDLVEKYGVSRQCISSIKFKRTWKHIHEN